MWYMELKVKTKYVLGLPGGTQIVLEHGQNNIRTMTTNPLTPLGEGGGCLTAVKDSMVFFKASLRCLTLFYNFFQ